MVALNDFPDKCIIKIFANLPLNDLYQMGSVSTRWHTLQHSVGAQHSSLTLVIGGPHNPNVFAIPFSSDLVHDDDGTHCFVPQDDDPLTEVRLNAIDTVAVHRLVHVFPNISTLVIKYNSQSGINEAAMGKRKSLEKNDFEPILLLLYQYWSQLTTLKLFIEFENYVYAAMPIELSHQMYDMLNYMISLKHLTLQFSAWLRCYCDGPTDFETRSFLPIIGQLDEFNLYSADHLDIVLEQMKRFAEHSKRPLRLGYGNNWLTQDIEQFDQFTPEFCARFTNLPFHHSRSALEPEQVKRLSRRFPSLTTLSVVAHIDKKDTISGLLVDIEKFTKLVYLKFDIHFGEHACKRSSLAQLPSIKILDLHYSTDEHNTKIDLCSILDVPTIFPNVQVINLRKEAAKCLMSENVKHGSSVDDPKIVQSTRELAQSFKENCAKLRKVYLDGVKFDDDDDQVR